MADELLYQGYILDLLKRDGRWEVVEHKDAVVVLASRVVAGSTEVLGVFQERPANNCRTWELPAGLIDAGESPEDAAKRELAEEVGLSGDMSLITQCFTSPGFCTEKIYLFEASHLYEHSLPADEGEVLEPSWQPLEHIWQAIATGELASSAPSCLGLSYLLQRQSQA